VHRCGTILGLTHIGRRLDLLGQPVLQANHLVAKRLPGQNLVFAGLPADELAETRRSRQCADAIRALTVVPELPYTQQDLAVLGLDEMRMAQDLAEHRIDRLRVCGRRNGNGPIISALRYPRSTFEGHRCYRAPRPCPVPERAVLGHWPSASPDARLRCGLLRLREPVTSQVTTASGRGRRGQASSDGTITSVDAEPTRRDLAGRIHYPRRGDERRPNAAVLDCP
jgi:hypothetical protein